MRTPKPAPPAPKPAPRVKTKPPALESDPDVLKAAAIWWAQVVQNPNFQIILGIMHESRAYVGIQSTEHGQIYAGGHNEGWADFATKLQQINPEQFATEQTGDFAE